MRDLFQVVFALKKKEIELAKQHLEKTCYPTSPLFSDSSSSSSKVSPSLKITLNCVHVVYIIKLVAERPSCVYKIDD